MEDVVAANVVKEVNNGVDRIYYELDGEGDADSSTTPTSHNVDHHRDREYYQFLDGKYHFATLRYAGCGILIN